MGKIKRNRSINYAAPAATLAALTAGLAPQMASADTVVGSDTTVQTGWDRNDQGSAAKSDATSALSSARSDITSSAHARESSVTSSAPKASGEQKTGWVDVYVDHTNLDDALQYATMRGVNVTHDPTVVKMGDGSYTSSVTSEAKSYYADKASEAKSTADKYVKDLANYHAEVEKNKQDAIDANDQMNALRATLAAQGQTTSLVSKQYSKSGLDSDITAIQQKIADGKAYVDDKAALNRAETAQDSMTLFTSQEAEGNINLEREDVIISNDADAEKYIQDLNSQMSKLQDYVNSLRGQTGTVPKQERPTFTLYNFKIDPNIEAKGTAVVPTYHYTPIPVDKPAVPNINYHIYDIRDQATADETWDNTDGETIILTSNANANGNVVAQAMVNQTVGIRTDQQPLPSQRFDKIEDLTIVTKIPDGATFDAAKSNTDPADWTMTYDENSRTVRQTATPEYLVRVNLNQDTNNSGTVGGTTDGEWKYSAPQIYFKLDKDNTTYQTHSTTIVNKEYMYVGKDIQIRTDSADPAKANTNSHYQLIDGKAVLPGSINNYIVGWDFDQYKNVNIDKQMQQKGLVLVDDFPDDAVKLTGPIQVVDPKDGTVLYSADLPANTDENADHIKVGTTGNFKDANGKDVNGFTWTVIDRNNAPDDLKDKINGKGIMIKYTGYDNDFYKKYVEGGTQLDVIFPMTTLKIDNTKDVQGGTYNGNTYSNVAYQSDFGNDYKSNTVTNTAPLINPTKDAVMSFANLTTLDINKDPQAEIEDGSWFYYRLNGSTLPTNLSEDINSYTFTDSFDTQNDEYDGEFIVQTDTDIHFKDGSTLAYRYPDGIKAGSDISKYFTQNIKRTQNETNVSDITLSADRDFLDQIDLANTNLSFESFLKMKRIQNTNDVKNVFNENINNVDYGSNEVVTNSKPNSIDLLNQQLKSLESSASSGISSNASGVKSNADQISSVASSTASALSIVIKTITSVKDSASSAISSVASSASSATNSLQSSAQSALSSTATVINSHISSVASSTASAISSVNGRQSMNESAASSAISSANSAMTSISSSAASAIGALAIRFENATEQTNSTLDIYDPKVQTDNDAFNYAVSDGIAAGSIRKIDKVNGHWVVTYNDSQTAINGSIHKHVEDSGNGSTSNNAPIATGTTSLTASGSTQIGDNTTATSNAATTAKDNRPVEQYTFYLLKSVDQVKKQLYAYGYTDSDIKSITKDGKAYNAVVYAK